MSTVKTTLEFEFPMHRQHPLFRLCIQCAVAMEEDFPQDVRDLLAKQLRAAALEYVGAAQFKEAV